MSKGTTLARVMDAAAGRVLSGTERIYDVALDTARDLVHLDRDDESPASWTAYVHWMDISETFDAMGGPESEELCDAIGVEFSQLWLELPNRQDESTQSSFMRDFDAIFHQRLAEHRAAH